MLFDDFSGLRRTMTISTESLVTRKPPQQASGMSDLDVGLEADDGHSDPEDKQLVYTTTPPQPGEPTTLI